MYFFIYEKLEMNPELSSRPYNFVVVTGYIYFLHIKNTQIGLI